MKKSHEFQKALSILLISVFVTTTPGCYSIKTLTNNDIPYPEKSHYVIHGKSVKYNLTNVSVAGGILTGTLENIKTKPPKSQTVQLYVSSDSMIVKSGELISVPVQNLTKIEVHEFSAVITGILVGVIVIAVAGLIYGLNHMSVNYGAI